MLAPFGEWLPDLPELGNPGSLTAKNVIPAGRSYLPFKSLSLQTNALDARVRGAMAARDSDNNVYFYAGTETKLYELVASIFTDESKGGGYSTATDDNWEFAVWKGQLVATNFTDAVQEIAIGGGSAGAFADLFTSTNKPKARHIAVVGQFLVLGNTSDATDGARPFRVWWSGIGDITDMDPDATTQSDFNDNPDGGWVRKIVGGAEYGVIFQERQISRMTYVGSPLVFDIQPVDRSRGTQIPGSVVSYGRLIFYIADDGFYAFDGFQSAPIGYNKVDKTFLNQFDIANKRFISAAIDPVNKTVNWAFPGSGSTGGQPNKIFIYSWADNKWSEAEVDTDIISSAVTQGYTLETLDTVGTDIDDSSLFPVSFDSDFWKGGGRKLTAFDTAHKMGFFTGSNLAATIDTTEAQPIRGQRAIITSVRPLIDNAGAAISRAASLSDPFTMTVGSATVTVGHVAHGLSVGDSITFENATPVLGITVDGSYSVASVVDADSYTITHSKAAGENLLTRSEEFDHADWTKTRSSISANATTAPDGTLTADKIVEDTATGEHYADESFTTTAGITYTFSGYVEDDGTGGRLLYLRAASSNDAFQIMDPTDGTLRGTGGGEFVGSNIEDVEDGRYRCSVTFLADTTGSTVFRFQLREDTGGLGTGSYTGDGTSGLYIWGAQLEKSSTANAYVQTVASAIASPQTGGGTVAYTYPLAGPTIKVGARNRQIDAVSFGASSSINAIGECPVRVNGRYLRARLEMPADHAWSHAQGIEATATPAGGR